MKLSPPLQESALLCLSVSRQLTGIKGMMTRSEIQHSLVFHDADR